MPIDTAAAVHSVKAVVKSIPVSLVKKIDLIYTMGHKPLVPRFDVEEDQ